MALVEQLRVRRPEHRPDPPPVRRLSRDLTAPTLPRLPAPASRRYRDSHPRTDTQATPTESTPCPSLALLAGSRSRSSCSRRPGGLPDLRRRPLRADHRSDLRGEAAVPAASRLPAEAGGEDVRFTTADGLRARRHLSSGDRTGARPGVIVFCHEYLSDRWSYPALRRSAARPRLRRLHVRLPEPRRERARPELPPAPVGDRPRGARPRGRAGLPAVAPRPRSGRGSASSASAGVGAPPWCVAAADPDVWGVITDGAVPDPRHDARLHPPLGRDLRRQPVSLEAACRRWVFQFVGWAGRVRSERRLNCRFPDVETAVGPALAPPLAHDPRREGRLHRPRDRPGPLRRGRRAKELWIVPEAKHNRCREVAPEAYDERVAGFFLAASRRRARGHASRGARTPGRGRRGASHDELARRCRGPGAAELASRRSIRRLADIARCLGALPCAHGPGRTRFGPRRVGRSARDADAGDPHRLFGSWIRGCDVRSGRRSSACRSSADRAAAGAGHSSSRPRAPTRSSATCSCAGSPGTPTASSAATTTSARSARPPTSAARCRSAATTGHEPYIERVRQGDLGALFGAGHRSPDVRDDLGHDEPAQDDPRHRGVARRLPRRLDDLGHPGLRRAPRHASSAASSRSSNSPATGARASRPPASPAARSPA